MDEYNVPVVCGPKNSAAEEGNEKIKTKTATAPKGRLKILCAIEVYSLQ